MILKKVFISSLMVYITLITLGFSNSNIDPLIEKFKQIHYEIKNMVNLTKAYDNPQQVALLGDFYLTQVFPKVADYKAGKISKEEFEKNLNKVIEMKKSIKQVIKDTESLKIYIWPKGKMPSNTVYKENPDCKFWDEPEFQPFLIPYLLDGNIKPKGAVIICPGGGYFIRAEFLEGDPYARFFNSKGYQAFVLNYRVAPYTPMESALDLQRAIRFVRFNAQKFNIDPDNIFVAGGSAGGSVCLDVANELYGDILPDKIVKDYIPDEIDRVSADVKGIIGLYTALGIMSPTGPKIVNPNFPPVFFVIGNQDFLISGTMSTVQLLLSHKVPLELHIFEGAGHGFGLGYDLATGNPIPGVSQWPELASIWLDKILSRKK